jgi:hypothetical protein
MKAGIPDAGHFGLGRERHHDLPVEGFGSLLPAGIPAPIIIVVSKLPGPVEIGPPGALRLRTRMQVAALGFPVIHCSSPSGPKWWFSHYSDIYRLCEFKHARG